MKTGDLLLRNGMHWVVRNIDRRTRLATLLNEDMQTEWVPLDLDKRQPSVCQVICNPPDEWPFIAISAKSRRGRLVVISRAASQGHQEAAIVQWRDWVSADPLRLGGGPVFFNPILRLIPSETLIATFEAGPPVRIMVPMGFGTVQQRKDRAAVKPVEAKTAFDRLMDDEDPYEEG